MSSDDQCLFTFLLDVMGGSYEPPFIRVCNPPATASSPRFATYVVCVRGKLYFLTGHQIQGRALGSIGGSKNAIQRNLSLVYYTACNVCNDYSHRLRHNKVRKLVQKLESR